MVYRGHVQGGVIILDDSGILPEGSRVKIEPEITEDASPSWGEVLKDFIGKAEGLPADFAKNHDHYIHGAPKK